MWHGRKVPAFGVSLLLPLAAASLVQNLTRRFGIKSPTEALQWVRNHVGDATIFCGGTMATSPRGISYCSMGRFCCPTTLLNITIPKGHSTEAISQAFMIFCGELRLAMQPHLLQAAECPPELPLGHVVSQHNLMLVPAAASADPALKAPVLQGVLLRHAVSRFFAVATTASLQCSVPCAACTAGDARGALRRLGQVNEDDREYVDVCVTQQDLDGCLKKAAWLRTSYQFLKGDAMMEPTSLEPLFGAR